MNDYQNGTYGLTPIGTIIHFMGIKAPNGYLFCDGTVYNMTDYPEFCDFLLDQFGSVNKFGGDGTTTFAVPDLRGEFLRCTGNTDKYTYSNGGAAVGAHQTPTMSPTIVNDKDRIEYVSATTGDDGKGAPMYQDGYYSATTTRQYRLGAVSSLWDGNTGWTTHYASRPTNTSVYMCIRVK